MAVDIKKKRGLETRYLRSRQYRKRVIIELKGECVRRRNPWEFTYFWFGRKAIIL